MRFFIIIFFLLLLPVSARPQSDSSAQASDTDSGRLYLLQKVNRNGIELPEVEIKEVTIVARPRERKIQERKYDRLIYNLKKVYPYALLVREELYQVNIELSEIQNEKDRRQYLRDYEKMIFEEFEGDIRGMTITQGRLLIKLIDRETQNTSYTLIKQYRGGLTAVFWQGIARIFGTNLKDEYDPYGEDAVIEVIINNIEAGLL